MGRSIQSKREKGERQRKRGREGETKREVDVGGKNGERSRGRKRSFVCLYVGLPVILFVLGCAHVCSRTYSIYV